MTQYEIAQKYGVPKCDVGAAIKYFSNGEIHPIGTKDVITKDGIKLKVNEYKDWEVALAVARLYMHRSDDHIAKARVWANKADSIHSLVEAES